MPSFSTIASFAAVAFAAFASAAPVDAAAGVGLHIPGVASAAVGAAAGVDASVPVSVDAVVAAAADVPVLAVVLPRELRSIPDILADTISQVTPLVAKLGAITAVKDANIDVVGPITEAIVEVLHGAVGEVNALLDAPVEVVFGTVDGALDVKELAKTIGALLTLVFTGLGAVLNVIGWTLHQPGNAVFNALCNVGIVVEDLLNVVFAIVVPLSGSVLDLVLPSIGYKIVPVILTLGLNGLAGILKVTF